MTIKDALNWARNKLDKSGIDSAGLDAEVLLYNALNTVGARQCLAPTKINNLIDKSFLYAHPEFELTGQQWKKYQTYVARRQRGEPVAYIIGHKEFYGLKFLVDKNVLIPRPETEILVDEVLKIIDNKQKTMSKGRKLTIVDVGTGSGCIIISILKKAGIKHQDLRIKGYGTDICERALRVAEKNARFYGVDKEIVFLTGNLLKPIIREQNNHGTMEQWNNWILVANLPYLDTEHKNLLNSSATAGLKFEPKKALYAGTDGLESYREFFGQINELKHKPGHIACEIGDEHPAGFKMIVQHCLPEAGIKIRNDLAGLNRVAIVRG